MSHKGGHAARGVTQAGHAMTGADYAADSPRISESDAIV